MAVVIKKHASNGLIKVFGAGRSNDVPNQIDRDVNFTDDSKLTFGDSTTPDLQIYHNNDSFIDESGAGGLFIRSTNGDGVYIYAGGTGSSNKRVFANGSGSVDLYYGSVKRFETTSTGISVTGSITTNLSSEGTYFTGGSGGIRQLSITSGTNISAHALHTFNIDSSNGKYEFDVNGTTEFSLDSSSATFAGDVTLGTNDFTAGTATIGGILIQDSADRGGLLEINKKGTNSWSGTQIKHDTQLWSLMGNAADVGLYDDTNSKWVFLYNINSSLELKYNGTTKITTTSAGADINGDLTVEGGDIILEGTGRIQGIDTITDGTDAVNKNYVDDNFVDGSGTANDVAMWLDSDTLTDAPIAISGNNAHFIGNVELGDGTDISMDASANGQLMIDGNGYQGAIAVGSSSMAIYHNSSSRDLVLGTNETARLTIDGSTGNATFAGNITLGANYIGRDTQNYITFSTDDNIIYRVGDTFRFQMSSSALFPYADSTYNLGSTSLRWANVYADNFHGLAKDLEVTSNDTFNGTYSLLWHDGADVYSSTWMTVTGSNDTFSVPNISTTSDVTVGGRIGINMAPSSSYQLATYYNQTNPDDDFRFAHYIDADFSGADNTTGDREQGGIFIDIDSSADGDASNEHRLYGIYVDQRFTGYSDLSYGVYGRVESNNDTEKTAAMAGVYGFAAHDSGANGGVTNMYGVNAVSQVEDNGDVDNAHGVLGQTIITSTRAVNVDVTYGGRFEVQIDSPNAISYGSMHAVSATIDNNESAVPTFGNQYLYYGDYSGTKGSNAYGLYITLEDKNYLSGNLGIGTTSPSQALDVNGTIKATNAGANLVQGAFVAHSSTSDSPSYRGQGYFTYNEDYDVSWYMGTPYTNGDFFVINRQNSATSFDTGAANIGAATTDNFFSINNSGNVGIGTTSISSILHLKSASPIITIEDSDVAGNNGIDFVPTGYSSRGSIFMNYTNAELRYSAGISNNTYIQTFYTNGNERMRINSSGHIGIANTNPLFELCIGAADAPNRNMLEIAVNSSDAGTNIIQNYNRATAAYTPLNIAASVMTFGVGTYATERMRIDSSGNVLINRTGASGLGKLNVDGGADFTGGNVLLCRDTGNVGIGTSSPSYMLDVAEKIRIVGGMAITPTTSTLYATDGTLSYYAAANAVYLNGAGSSGWLRLNGAGSENDRNSINIFGSAGDYMNFRTANAERMRIDSSGNVGIAQSSPANNLHIGSNVSGNTYPGLTLQSVTGYLPHIMLARGDGSYSATGNSNWIIANSDNGFEISRGDNLLTSSSARNTALQINNTGNVGIGTISPGYKLDVTNVGADAINVNASTDFTGIRWSSTAHTYSWRVGGGTFFIYDVNNAQQRVTLNASGNLGIGETSPTSKLHVKDTPAATSGAILTLRNSQATASNTTFGGIFFNSAPGYDFSIGKSNVNSTTTLSFRNGNSGASLMDIDAAGNVGIGTTSPEEKLHVAGNLKVEGGIVVQNTAAHGYIAIPDGAYYHTSSSSHTGAIKITLPVHGTADMLSFVVDIYDYTTNESITVYIKGYLYQQTGSNEWVNTSVQIIASDISRNYTVRFGADGSNNCVWIGETNSTWTYPQVQVRDFTSGFNTDIDSFTDGWDVSFVTSFDTVDETVSNTFPISKEVENSNIRITNSGNSYLNGGNVGIGTTSPNNKLTVSGGSDGINITGTSSYIQWNTGDMMIRNEGSYAMGFHTYTGSALTEKMRIDSSGNVGIGVTSPIYKFHVASSNNVSIFEDTSGSSNAAFCLFNVPSNFAMGSITRNGTANSILFNTGSDYRLKEDLQDFNALDLVDNITAYDYKWKDTEQRDYGFVAHELQEVMPNVVTGEKDGERMQGVDYSKLTPVLLKAIQELKAEIETLKAQINN